MQLPVLIFPHTDLRPTTLNGLAPLCAPVMVLQPPSLGPGAEGPAMSSPLAEAVRPAGGADAAGPEARRLAGLLRQWEDWARSHRHSAEAEAVKAGVEPPPPPETVRSLMGDIRKYSQGPEVKKDTPEVSADLFLHLAHVQDREAAELEGLLARYEDSAGRLGHVMGLDQPDTVPADYEGYVLDRLPPVDYSLPEDHQLERRLAAWATLAGAAGDSDAWLATASGPAARLLMERADALLLPREPELRSPAGAVAPFGDPAGEPRPDTPRPQEAARLVLPDLSGLTPEALTDLAGRLAEAGDLDGLRAGLATLLKRLAAEKWGPALAGELAGAAKTLAEDYDRAVRAAGATLGKTGRGLSLLAFPGLTRADLLSLMRDGRPGGAPRSADWPDAWPDGSCPVLVLW